MFRHVGKIGIGIRLACMSVMLLAMAVCAEAVKDVGANLTIDSRLSSLEEQEYKSWANYIKAQLCRGDESLGLPLYKQYIGEALKLAPDSEFLLEQWCLGRDLASNPERHATDLKPIWEAHPENVRLTMFYLDLLIQAGLDRQALEAVLFSQERLGWRSGVLTLRYVEIAQTGGRTPIVEEKLGKSLAVCRDDDLTSAHVAAACYWRDCHFHMQTMADEQKMGRFKRLYVNILSSQYRRRSLTHARKASARPGGFDMMSAYALSNVFKSFECWEEQIGYLERLKESGGADLPGMVWYFMETANALRKLGRLDELRELLEQVTFGREWNRQVLETAAEAYLELKDFGRACEMYEMLSQQDPRNIRYRLIIAHISLVQRQSVKGLAALAPLRALPPAGCELKARLLEQHGEHEKAYEEYTSLLKLVERSDLDKEWKPGAAFYDGLTMVCLSLKKHDEALRYVKALYEQDPEDAHGCNFYGYLLADFDRELDLAEKLIRKALDQEPDNVAYIDSLAWVRYRQGRYAEALDEMCKVLAGNGMEQDPDGELSEHMAAILKKLGFDGTAAFYQKMADGLKK